MNTDIDQPASAALGLTLLRVVTGLVIGAHALEKLVHLRAFQGELIQVGMPRPEFVAFLILTMEVAASLMLLMGRFTRLAALATVLDALLAIAIIGLQHRTLESLGRLETAALMGAAGFYLVSTGYEWLEVNFFGRRSRLQAAAEAALWQRPEGDGGAPATLVYETPEGLVYEAPLFDAASPSDMRRRPRRRWLERHAS